MKVIRRRFININKKRYIRRVILKSDKNKIILENNNTKIKENEDKSSSDNNEN